MVSPVLISAITDIKTARSAFAYFRRRSWLGKITRDGVTKLTLFVPDGTTTNGALVHLQSRVRFGDPVFIEPGPWFPAA